MFPAEIVRHRSLVWALARRDLLARYRGTFLGFGWTFLHQVLYMATYSIVFGLFARLDVPHYPAFVLTGLLPWTWFSSCLLIGSTSILADAPLVRRAAFPASVPPVVVALSTLVNFLLGLPLLLGVFLLSGVRLTPWLLATPLLVLLQLALSGGLAVGLAALTVRFRDTHQLAQAMLPIAFFLTPVVYPASLVSERLPGLPGRLLLWANPLALLVRSWQRVLFLGEPPEPLALLLLAVAGLVSLLVGGRVFEALRDRIPEEV